MTSYIETQLVAHVMEWRRDHWQPICRARYELRPAEYQGRDDWPLKHAWRGENLPSVRWCRWCVTHVQRQVDELMTTVLIPAAS